MHSAHILDWHSAITALYTDAAGLGLPVAHIAVFYLERYLMLFTATVAIERLAALPQAWSLAQAGA